MPRADRLLKTRLKAVLQDSALVPRGSAIAISLAPTSITISWAPPAPAGEPILVEDSDEDPTPPPPTDEVDMGAIQKELDLLQQTTAAALDSLALRARIAARKDDLRNLIPREIPYGIVQDLWGTLLDDAQVCPPLCSLASVSVPCRCNSPLSMVPMSPWPPGCNRLWPLYP
jgi:hypothetical protein